MRRYFSYLAPAIAALGALLLAGGTATQEEPTAIIATFDVLGERFRVRIENPATIEQVRALERGESAARIPNGRLLRGSDGNEPWSWHLDPMDIELSEITIELCDGRPSFVEADLDYWVDTVGRFCPWSAVLVSVKEVDGAKPTPSAPPAAPKELEALVVHDQLQITLRWQDNADNEDFFVVERSTAGPSGPWTVVATLAADSSQYDDIGLEDGVTYWYRVAAMNAAGTSDYSNVASGTATALPTPSVGDANCDGSVNSIDAALVLQLEAGLLPTLQCPGFADVNEDGEVDSIDAALILQFEAGLIEELMGGGLLTARQGA